MCFIAIKTGIQINGTDQREFINSHTHTYIYIDIDIDIDIDIQIDRQLICDKGARNIQ